jgi:uncharacterized protein
MLTRRDLLRSGAFAAGSLGLAPAFFRSARAGAAKPAQSAVGPYGPLQPPDANGLMLPQGFTSRVIAQGNQPVLGTAYTFPIFPDGSATYPTPDGGWILAVNSEVPNVGAGGASAIRFGPDGTAVDAYRILGGTMTNCAGGATPWGTWLSCEEHDDGEVWECDPTGARAAVAHPAMGRFNHEAVCVDPEHQRLYLSEDKGDGGFYRFTPTAYPDLAAGVLEVARVGGDGRVEWIAVPDPQGGAANPTRAQVPSMTQFKRGEGICFDAGIVYLATTSDHVVHAYDTRTERLSRVFDAQATADPPLLNPDNITANRAGELFVGEDDGEDDPLDLCVITPEGEVARFLKVTGSQHGIGGDLQSEVTGPSFDPSGTRLYFSSQRAFVFGVVYEVSGPFRTQRPAGGDVGTPEGPGLGLEVPRRIRRSRLLADGLPVAATLDRAAELRIAVTARMAPRPGARVRTVRLATLTETAPAGMFKTRVKARRSARRALRGRKRPLRAKVVVRVGSERVERPLRII